MSDLAGYIGMSTTSQYALRSDSLFRTRTYNLSRQVVELIDHCFVKYPVPVFLYRAVVSRKGLGLLFEQSTTSSKRPGNPEGCYFDWFMVVAAGGSFAKATQGVLSKKEAHWFLLAPNHNSIRTNIRWARAAAAGVPLEGCQYLVEHFLPTEERALGDRRPDFLRLFASLWNEMRTLERAEVIDFLRETMGNSEFSYKGRTLGSIRKLTREWHRTFHTGEVAVYKTWSQRFGAWEHRRKCVVLRAFEITNNRALADEGQKLRHCVYGYAEQCVSGMSSIVSFRHYASGLDGDLLEVGRLTLQVNIRTRQVVQIRGKLNRTATVEEMKHIRLWAGAQGLEIDPWAN